MKFLSTLSLTALAVPALAALLAPADKLAFKPAAGTALERSWTSKLEISLDESSVSVNGQPMPDMGVEMQMSSALDLEVSDHVVGVEGGRPKELRRTYDKLGSDGSLAVKSPQGDVDKQMKGSSELEGKSVKFTWNADEKRYDVAWLESEGDAKLLEKLGEDLDLREFLPGKDVAKGDEWKIDPNAFRSVLQPGGDLGIRPELEADEQDAIGSMGMDMDTFRDMSRLVGETIEGDSTARYAGTREADGITVGEVRFDFKLKSSTDATEMMKQMMAKLPAEAGTFDIDHVDVDFSLAGEGTLLWDVAGGYVHSFELTGKVEIKQDVGMKLSMDGRNAMSIESTSTLSGSLEHQVTVRKG